MGKVLVYNSNVVFKTSAISMSDSEFL